MVPGELMAAFCEMLSERLLSRKASKQLVVLNVAFSKNELKF